MIEIAAALSAATTAFNAIKKGVSVGASKGAEVMV